MTATQTAANEFLRQFWLTIYPPPTDLPTASALNPAQKAAKAVKMIGYLERTQEKVDALVQGAHSLGVDPDKIRIVSSVAFYSGCTLNVHSGYEACPRRRGKGGDLLAA